MNMPIKINIKPTLSFVMFLLQALCCAIIGCNNIGAQNYPITGECKGSYTPAQNNLTPCPTGQYENQSYPGTKCPAIELSKPKVPTCVSMPSPPCTTLCYVIKNSFPCYQKEWHEIDRGTTINGTQYVVCKCEKTNPNLEMDTCNH